MMEYCSVSVLLAYAMAAYCIASVVYLAITFGSGSRPFHDSLTKRQLHVLKKSKKKRRNIFLLGVAVSICVLYYFKPFNSCYTPSVQSAGYHHHQPAAQQMMQPPMHAGHGMPRQTPTSHIRFGQPAQNYRF